MRQFRGTVVQLRDLVSTVEQIGVEVFNNSISLPRCIAKLGGVSLNKWQWRLVDIDFMASKCIYWNNMTPDKKNSFPIVGSVITEVFENDKNYTKCLKAKPDPKPKIATSIVTPKYFKVATNSGREYFFMIDQGDLELWVKAFKKAAVSSSSNARASVRMSQQLPTTNIASSMPSAGSTNVRAKTIYNLSPIDPDPDRNQNANKGIQTNSKTDALGKTTISMVVGSDTNFGQPAAGAVSPRNPPPPTPSGGPPSGALSPRNPPPPTPSGGPPSSTPSGPPPSTSGGPPSRGPPSTPGGPPSSSTPGVPPPATPTTRGPPPPNPGGPPPGGLKSSGGVPTSNITRGPPPPNPGGPPGGLKSSGGVPTSNITRGPPPPSSGGPSSTPPSSTPRGAPPPATPSRGSTTPSPTTSNPPATGRTLPQPPSNTTSNPPSNSTPSTPAPSTPTPSTPAPSTPAPSGGVGLGFDLSELDSIGVEDEFLSLTFGVKADSGGSFGSATFKTGLSELDELSALYNI
eukprot:TRINITY_DN504_c0_g1_i2.p1 TRINITY_DN504_c0_g1~~TRINITY_DN504_c0_g1_i2.p1  ORF type:complete len:515 (+),score=203.09 TRINITY_DN504_c0_g1_i2:262-1806(+)